MSYTTTKMADYNSGMFDIFGYVLYSIEEGAPKVPNDDGALI